jgi:gamma-glutamylcysteine synthetase
MRFKMHAYPFMGGYHVVITDYSESCSVFKGSVSSEFITQDDLKVDDMMHLLEVLHREVCATTP